MNDQSGQSQRRLGDYQILEEIGQGGMGVVYRAQHTFLNQIVALKVLPESQLADRQAILRFRREMLSIGGLNHPNVIRALNAGEDRGFHYLVTEFVDGVTLRALVAQRRQLPVGAACEIVRQAAAGLQYVHAHGLVHRDVKPANLMLSRDGVVKLLDLGLARLQSASVNRELTRPGIPMGTVDYMAPEQWLDSSSVDIRADIYSLGCTLFFLLTERPPCASECQDTQPGLVVDRVTAPIVKLCEQRPDCPPELETMLRYMLAEDPDERFDTPGEVADAIGLFARPREVAALWAGGLQVADQSGINSSAGILGPGSDTRQRYTRHSSFPGVASAALQGLPQRPGRRWDTVGVAAALLAVLAIWGGLHVFERIGSAPPMGETEARAASEGGGPAEARAYAVAHQADAQPTTLATIAAAGEVCTLPGLNGPWWFDEMPWLLPFVRQQIAHRLRSDGSPTADPGWDKNPALSSNVGAVQGWLLGLAVSVRPQLTAAQATLLDDLICVSQEDLSDDELAVRLREALQRFDPASAAGADPAAVDLHARAVLEHKVAAIASDRALAKTAAESYAAALEAYLLLGPTAASLRARCLVDCGQLYALVFRDYAEAKRRFREARALPEMPVLLQVEAWVNEAFASALANRDAAARYTEAGYALTSAQELLENSELASLNHPFAAHVHERYAWILMNQWNVRRSSAEFKEARSIRFDNFWKSKNDFAQIYVFHNDHGQAMAERYSGDDKMARAQYDLVIGEIEKALSKAEADQERPGTQRFRRELRERLSNACERRADCELHQGVATGAAVDLPEAARLYAVARDTADEAPVRAVMSYKRAIALALDGRVAEAQQELQQPHMLGEVAIGLHEERIRLLKKLADAVVTLGRPDVEGGLIALRNFLKDFDLNPDYPDRHRRETQELQLLAAELLVGIQLKDPQLRSAAAADADYLDRLIAAFPYREQMLTYLRRYYGLLIEARQESDPDRAAGYVLASRDQRPLAEAMMVLFHFTADRGRVILRSPDSTAICFPLAFGREQIKLAGRVDQAPTARLDEADSASPDPHPLLLPQQLVDLIVCERESGRQAVIFWDDSRCWARAEAALTAKDWPFAAQLELLPQ